MSETSHRPSMPRNRTGLRNKIRNRKGTYHLKNKSRAADFYGKYDNGRQLQPERIRG